MMSQDSYLQMKINYLIANTNANELTRGNLTDEETLTVARRINVEAGRQTRGCHHVHTTEVDFFPPQQ